MLEGLGTGTILQGASIPKQWVSYHQRQLKKSRKMCQCNPPHIPLYHWSICHFVVHWQFETGEIWSERGPNKTWIGITFKTTENRDRELHVPPNPRIWYGLEHWWYQGSICQRQWIQDCRNHTELQIRNHCHYQLRLQYIHHDVGQSLF